MLHKDLKRKWREWKQFVNNNPDVDEKNNLSYCQYKDVKRQFRAELRRAERKYDKEQMIQLAELQHIDHAEFWKLVNKARKSPPKVCLVDLGTHSVTDPEEICETWKSYFQKLYTPSKDAGCDQ